MQKALQNKTNLLRALLLSTSPDVVKFFTSRSSLFLLLFFTNLIPELVNAEPPQKCALPAEPVFSSINTSSLPSKKNITGINISADYTRTDISGVSEFSGNVSIEREGFRFVADTAKYNNKENTMSLIGNIHAATKDMVINAETGTVNLKDNSSELSKALFNIQGESLKGETEKIISNDTGTKLIGATVTSCELDDADWTLQAQTIKLNHVEQYGSAKNIVVEFFNVPIFYTPYIEFPLGDQRRSGLLVPEIGNSDARGFEFTLPWYWNIAPNHDATITPRQMSERGIALNTLYRYLTESSMGDLGVSYLADDDETSEDRYELRYNNHTNINDQTYFNIDVNDVSDIAYLNDFSTNLLDTSTSYLNRTATFNYLVENWQLQMLAQSHETIDINIITTSRPYRRVPAISFNGDQKIAGSGFMFTMESEFVEFDHEDITLTTGNRLHVKPGISLPMSGSYWHFTPSYKYLYTQYDVEDGTGTKLNLDTITTSTTSIDTGLTFERTLSNGTIHTLEPRIFYLNTGFVDQTAYPVFDSTDPDFNFNQLFSETRYTGNGLIGDTEQITLALTNRFINPATGNEILYASIGEIFYLKDRLATLTGPVESSEKSDLLGEIGSAGDSWSGKLTVQWDQDTDRSLKQSFNFHYQPSPQYILNLSYREKIDSLLPVDNYEHFDVSFKVPLAGNISAIGRWNYSLLNKYDLDVLSGIEYNSCCWSAQLVGQRRLRDINDAVPYDSSIMLQLVFKGLGSVSGNRAQKTLEQAILGYKGEY